MEYKPSFAISVKLIAFISVTISVFVTKGSPLAPFVFVVALIYLLFGRSYKNSINYLIFYGILSFLLYGIREYGLRMIIFSEFNLFLFWWMTPIFMVAVDLMTSPPGQISSFLSKLHAPTSVILATLVVFRFFPTMKTEIRSLRESMHNRGLSSAGQIIMHPAETYEYILVPILMRCIQIADTLAISSLSRGIETPVRRTSYYAKAMSIKDYLCIVCWVASAVGFIVFRGRV